VSPRFWARRIRKKSLEFPMQKTVQISTARQYASGSGTPRRRGRGAAGAAAAAAGPRASRSRPRNSSVSVPGITANQRIERSETPDTSRRTASSGPTTAPTVSIARW
jgi:hypothetical protein